MSVIIHRISRPWQSIKSLQLRDIFRVHLNTACHTHDLLDCPCDGTQQDVQRLDDTPNDDNDADDDEKLEKGFVVASQIKPEQISKQDRLVGTNALSHRRVP